MIGLLHAIEEEEEQERREEERARRRAAKKAQEAKQPKEEALEPSDRWPDPPQKPAAVSGEAPEKTEEK